MSRILVSLPQLATYIERDGWKRIPGAPSGTTRYGDVAKGFSVTIPDHQLPALELERDRAYAAERTRQLRSSK